MKKVMRLISVQLWAMLGDMLSIGNNRKKKPKILYLGVLLFILMMSGISFFYSLMIGSGLRMFDCLDILPAMMMAITCLIVLITTTLKIKGTVFGFKDYDMVMSLPISTSAVVASRLLLLYFLNLVFVIIMMVPLMVAYGLLAAPSIIYYVISIITMLLLPLVPIVIASILGTVIAYAASKFRYHNILNIIFTISLLMAFVGFSFTMGDTGQELVDMSLALTNQVNSIYPLAQMYTKAVVEYDITSFVEFAGISLLAFTLYVMIVQKVFKKMNTAIMTGGSRTKYKMGELKTASPFIALYRKEIKRYFSSTLYVLNTGFGIVFLTLAAVASLFVDLDQVLGDPSATTALKNSVSLFLAFCVMMSSTTACSISLEGRNWWIMKSLPVQPKTIYLAKIAVNLTIVAPAVLDALIIGMVLELGLAKTLLLMLLTIVCAIFISFYGLIINLLLPNFNWSSEVVVVKQSAATMITIFSGMAIAVLQLPFFLFLPTTVLAFSCYILLILLADIVLYSILLGYGKKRFVSL